LEHGGFNLSEDFVFGVGSGLNLAYHHGDDLVPDAHWRAPLTIITGRAIAPYEEAASVLGVQLYSRFPTNNDEAWLDLKDCIDRGLPVVCVVDQEVVLAHYGRENPLTKRFGWRFGGHKTIVIGYDLAANTATVVENMFPQTFEVGLDVLARMRSTADALYPPRNHRFTLVTPKKLQSSVRAVKMGITKNVQRMREPDYRGNGLPAVDWMTEELAAWPELLDKDRLEASILMASLQCEQLSGGGMYRNMYARFLRQADDLVPHQNLVLAAKQYRQLARDWSSLVGMMVEALKNDRYTIFSSVPFKDALSAIHAGEHRAIDLLDEAVCSWD
jgi:hypothetical protein